MQIKNLKLILGQLNFNIGPTRIFETEIINFLEALSKEIMRNKKSREFHDLIAFGFWCRKVNILRVKENYLKKELLMGRGTALHICPSNVPLNFAYSLVFGLLSGNNNIVRLPSRNFLQTNLLVELIQKTLILKKFKSIKKRICLISYKKSKEISETLSKNAHARLIWGGDETIQLFKSYYSKPRCVDLFFSNRYSISVINSKKIKNLNKYQIKNLANNFYNDAYTMDQQGCSSPQALFWLGKKNDNRNHFLDELNKIVNLKYSNDLSVTNKKIYSISNMLLKTNLQIKVNKKNFKLITLQANKLNKEIEKIQCHFGTFLQSNISSLNELKKVITNRYQTMTYYGVEKKDLKEFIQSNHILGIDRIVPIGRAFDMGPVWDGYDIIYSLSRVIAE
jgi:hypothetical protein